MKWGCGSIGLALIVGSFAAWNLFIQRNYEHRFRLTIAVATPEGPKQGASVWATTCRTYRPPSLHSLFGGCDTVGEAVFIDLGQGRNLVGLMAGGPHGEGVDVYQFAARAFDYADVPRNRAGNTLEPWDSYAPGWRGSRELSVNNLPTLVTFSDLNDPASARVVEPTLADFASTFGSGYRLERVTLDMVPVGIWPLSALGIWGTPVTRGIEKKIPFLTTHREPLRRVSRDMPPRFQAEFWQFIRE